MSQGIPARWHTIDETHYYQNKESLTMSNMTKDEQLDWYDRTHKNWRSWGSWFSWGSPVGLGIFILALAGAAWIIAQI